MTDEGEYREYKTLVLLVCAFFLLSTIPAIADWTSTVLHPNQFYSTSDAVGVGGIQQVGTAHKTSMTDNDHAMIWYGSESSQVDLNPLLCNHSRAYDTDGTQQVGSAYGTITLREENAFLWNSSSTSYVNLHPDGYESSVAYGIGDGQQVGYALWVEDFSGTTHAALWSGTAESFVDMHPEGYSYSGARDTSDGQQIGYVSGHAALWSGTAESFVDLHPEGYSWSSGYGVCDGYQVGVADNHAGLWNGTAESFIDLNPSGADKSYAYGICDDLVVGWADWPTDYRHAVIWGDAFGGFMDLHGYLPSYYDQSEARGIYIAADGTITVVGFAIDYQGGTANNAVMWSFAPVPEPGTLVSFGALLVPTLALMRQRRVK